MAKKKGAKPIKVTSAENESTRAALMQAAIKLFAQKGLDGTTVKDISDSAGVNISLVSYHFEGKEGLYRTCLQQFGLHRLESAKRMLQPAQSLEEFRLRLELFLEDLIVWFLQEPELCQMVQRESDLGFPIAEDVFENTFLKIYLTLFDFIKHAQQKKFLRSDVDSHIAASMFFSGFIGMLQKQKIAVRVTGSSLQDENYRKKLKTQVAQLLIEGLQIQEKKK